MADPFDTSDSSGDASSPQPPWGKLAAVGAFLVLGALTFWIMHEKKNDQARKVTQEAMDKELFADEESLKAQKMKLAELTRQVETLRTAIQVGDVKDGKASVAEFKKLAEDQRKAREDYMKMVDAYNLKVAEYRKLEQ